MIKENREQLIREALASIKKPVRVLLFTIDSNCDSCPDAVDTARVIKTASPKIAMEVYDLVMDRDKTEEYKIKRVPSFVVLVPGGMAVSFSGTLEGVSLLLFLDVVVAASNGQPWFPEKFRNALAQVRTGVSIKVIIENDCSLCKPVAETAVGLGVMSPLIHTEIIVADDFPDLLARQKIKVLPYTLFGASLHLEGHVTESEFLEMIFRAEGQRADGLDKICLVCGKPSPDIMCQNCKAKIQAEAVDHKRKDERSLEKGMAADSGHHRH